MLMHRLARLSLPSHICPTWPLEVSVGPVSMNYEVTDDQVRTRQVEEIIVEVRNLAGSDPL